MTIGETVARSGGRLPSDAEGGFGVRTGPFAIRLHLRIPEAFASFVRLYGAFPALPADAAADFYVALHPASDWRRPFRRLAALETDGVSRFGPFDRDSAWPYFEWGLNACVSRHTPHHLALHAASLEKNGGGLILLGSSGSGKSTMAAALMSRGWRLLSDEFALLRLDTMALEPLARPVCLKNDSIERVRRLLPDACFGPSGRGERKGIVAHLRPPARDVERMGECAPPVTLCILNLRPSDTSLLQPCGQAETMATAVRHAFNYQALGRQGFRLLADTVERCACFRLTVGDPVEAASLLEASR